MNSLVDFYELNTFGLNKCDPTLYNGRVPLLTRKHGANYLSSMVKYLMYFGDILTLI